MQIDPFYENKHKIENAKQATMSFVAEAIPLTCYITFIYTVDQGGPEFPCMTKIKMNQ